MDREVVMVVEDTTADATHLELQLEGIEEVGEIIIAEDGFVALGMLREMDRRGNAFPTLIFLDLRMPRVDGFQFLEAFEHYHPHHRSRVVVVTGSASDPDRIKALEYRSVENYVVKPVFRIDIQRVLRASWDEASGVVRNGRQATKELPSR
ncbi:MAG: response regulator [Myxococcota bacterium]